MIRQLPIYLATTALLASPLLAQDAPRPQPAPEAPKPEAPRPEPRRDSAQRDANAERPLPPPPSDGERPLPPPGRDGFGPGGPGGFGPGGPGFGPGGPPPGGGPQGGRPRDFQRRPPGDPRGDGPEGERPGGPGYRAPEGYGQTPMPSGDRYRQSERELKPTPYIGVVTSPVPPVLGAQLSLNEGFGLVVEDVLPDSPAKTAGLQKYDVLKLVNDQQLVDPGHLSGLLRSLGKDTEVKITFIRKGQEQKATLKIGEKMMGERRPGADLQRRFGNFGLWRSPRESGGDEPNARGPQGGDPEQMRRFQEHMQQFRDDMRRYQEQLRDWQKDRNTPMPEPPPAPDLGSDRGAAPTGPADLLREARPGGAPKLRLPKADGVSTFNTDRARVVMKDNDGEVEIAMRDGQRTVTAKDAGGKVVFAGPVDTPEQRTALPLPFRAKLEAIEAQQRNLAAERAPGPRGRDEAPFPPPPPPLPDEPEAQ